MDIPRAPGAEIRDATCRSSCRRLSGTEFVPSSLRIKVFQVLMLEKPLPWDWRATACLNRQHWLWWTEGLTQYKTTAYVHIQGLDLAYPKIRAQLDFMSVFNALLSSAASFCEGFKVCIYFSEIFLMRLSIKGHNMPGERETQGYPHSDTGRMPTCCRCCSGGFWQASGQYISCRWRQQRCHSSTARGRKQQGPFSILLQGCCHLTLTQNKLKSRTRGPRPSRAPHKGSSRPVFVFCCFARHEMMGSPAKQLCLRYQHNKAPLRHQNPAPPAGRRRNIEACALPVEDNQAE